MKLPYKIAVLCYLYDDQGRLLLLHRAQEPNRGLYSPIGGKLHMDEGESPHDCAVREIHEEVEVRLNPDEVVLAGMISEAAYEQQTHWLMFLYRVTRPVEVKRMSFNEGTLEWHRPQDIFDLNIPQTDRQVIYPMMARYPKEFFHVHIDFPNDQLRWVQHHPVTS